MDDFSHLTVNFGGIHDRISDCSDDAEPELGHQSSAAASPQRIFRHKKSSSSPSAPSAAADGDDNVGRSNENPETGDASGSRLQDKIFAKLLQQALPSDSELETMERYAEARKDNRPALSLTLMSGNFRRFNARVGIIFVLQHYIYRLFEWEKPTHTLSFLVIYSFICLNPHLVIVLPIAFVLLFIMVPAFIARHPPPPTAASDKIEPYTACGGPTAPPQEVKAVSEMSKDFLRNLKDLQNTMADFSDAHDQIIATIGPPTNFSDEKVSSGIFQALCALCIVLFIAAHLIPWGPVSLVSGWLIVGSLHPMVQNYLLSSNDTQLVEKEKQALAIFNQWVEQDIILDEEREMREVEIFELQRKTSSHEWEPWIFSSKPYEPLSPARIAHQRPQGTRFFEDVQPPRGWEFKDKKWTLDLGSNVWVQERYITGVDVEDENGRWVYDYILVDGKAERGDWRRRRWVRNVVRKRYEHRDSE